ncbi:hypothetical protein BDF22DRAFT_742472 [Syncephalis plumigaleata]|nr:hypothetical protein BDF22DRAFT_742472 [Syncephalis plumigaleata]
MATTDSQDGVPSMTRYNTDSFLETPYPNHLIHGISLAILLVSILATSGLLFYVVIQRRFNTSSQRLVLYLGIVDLALNITHLIDHSYTLASHQLLPTQSCITIGSLLQFWITLQQLLIITMAMETVLVCYLKRTSTFGPYDCYLWLLLLPMAGSLAIVGGLFGFYGSAGAWCYTNTNSHYSLSINGWLHLALPLCTMLIVMTAYCWACQRSLLCCSPSNTRSNQAVPHITEPCCWHSSVRSNSISSNSAVESRRPRSMVDPLEQHTASFVIEPWYTRLNTMLLQQVTSLAHAVIKSPSHHSRSIRQSFDNKPVYSQRSSEKSLGHDQWERPIRPLTAFQHKRFSFASSLSQTPSATKHDTTITKTSSSQTNRTSALVKEWTTPSGLGPATSFSDTKPEVKEDKDGKDPVSATPIVHSASSQSMAILEEVILNDPTELPSSSSSTSLPTSTLFAEWTSSLINQAYLLTLIIIWLSILIYIAYATFYEDYLTAQLCALTLFSISGLIHTIIYGWHERNCRSRSTTPLTSSPHMLWRHDTHSNRIVPGWKDSPVASAVDTRH